MNIISKSYLLSNNRSRKYIRIISVNIIDRNRNYRNKQHTHTYRYQCTQRAHTIYMHSTYTNTEIYTLTHTHISICNMQYAICMASLRASRALSRSQILKIKIEIHPGVQICDRKKYITLRVIFGVPLELELVGTEKMTRSSVKTT